MEICVVKLLLGTPQRPRGGGGVPILTTADLEAGFLHWICASVFSTPLWLHIDIRYSANNHFQKSNMSNTLKHKDLQREHTSLEAPTDSEVKSPTFSFPCTLHRFLTVIHLRGYIIGTTVGWLSPTHSFSLNALHASSVKKKKRKEKVTHEKKLTKSQTGRRERQNLIKFNKAERIAQAVNSNSAFSLLYNFCLLKHFYTPSFYLRLHSLTEE